MSSDACETLIKCNCWRSFIVHEAYENYNFSLWKLNSIRKLFAVVFNFITSFSHSLPFLIVGFFAYLLIKKNLNRQLFWILLMKNVWLSRTIHFNFDAESSESCTDRRSLWREWFFFSCVHWIYWRSFRWPLRNSLFFSKWIDLMPTWDQLQLTDVLKGIELRIVKQQ